MTKEIAKVKKDLERAKENKVDLEVWASAISASYTNSQQSNCSTPTPILGQHSAEVGYIIYSLFLL